MIFETQKAKPLEKVPDYVVKLSGTFSWLEEVLRKTVFTFTRPLEAQVEELTHRIERLSRRIDRLSAEGQSYYLEKR